MGSYGIPASALTSDPKPAVKSGQTKRQNWYRQNKRRNPTVALALPLTAGDIVEYRLLGVLDGQRTITTYHYLIGGGTPQDTDTTSLEAALRAKLWEESWQTEASSDFAMEYSQVQKIAPTRLVPYTYTFAPLSPGNGDAPCSASGVAVVIRRKTILASRQGQGRVYLPGIPVASVSNSLISALATAGWQAIADTIDDEVDFQGGARTATPIIYSTAAKVNRGTVAFTVLDRILRYQRRREVGVGQ